MHRSKVMSFTFNSSLKEVLTLLFLVSAVQIASTQTSPDLISGAISYQSSRNIYVKFKTTEQIEIGDTLYKFLNSELLPVLMVKNKSSSSTVCTPISERQFNRGEEILARSWVSDKKEPESNSEEKSESIVIEEEKTQLTVPVNPENKVLKSEARKSNRNQKIKGRLSAASYTSMSDYENRHRMRYIFSMDASHVNNSKFSLDSYISFRHTLEEWETVTENLNDALKIYSFSVNYDISDQMNLLLGRKINPKMSSIGAIDGIQIEQQSKNFTFGAIVGSRPDIADYSLNLDLLQFGAYVSYASQDPKKYQLTSFGFLEQRNGSNTDRRFAYFQHSSEIFTNMNLFGSFEIDLFENIFGEVNNSPRLTNLYLSLRYRASRKLRFNLSYDNRKNIIYYESYKSFIEQLIEDETRQGLRFGISYRPVKNINLGINSSVRLENSKTVSRNVNGYVSIARIPGIKARANIRTNFLETDYLRSQLLGIRISREIVHRKMSGDLYFRLVNYQYKSTGRKIQQKIAGASFSYRLNRKLSLYLYYEGTFGDQSSSLHRINTKIIQRF